MKYPSRFFSAALLAALVCGPMPSFGQVDESAAMTPRARVIAMLSGGAVTLTAPESIPVPEITPEPIPEPTPVPVPDQPPDQAPDQASVVDSDTLPTSPVPDFTPLPPPPVADVAPAATVAVPAFVPPRYGFFQTARDYLSLRGDAPETQMRLSYKITARDAVADIALKPDRADIIIGSDYAVMARGNAPAQIYDFKARRLLTLDQDVSGGDISAAQTFTNVSLYGARYKNIETVRRLTQNGTRRTVGAGKDTTLDAFFLESSMGWAAVAPPKDKFSARFEDGKFIADYDDKTVFSATFDGPDFEDTGHAMALVSLLFHTLPIHPSVLADIGPIDAAPNRMTIFKATPAAPKGIHETWMLSAAVTDNAPFPLPPTAKSVIEMEAVSPLAFVVTEAINGRALGGPPDPKATLEAMKERLDQGDVLAVWLSAKALSDKLGGCKKLSGLCAVERDAEAQGKGDRDLEVLFQAFADVKVPAKRAAAVQALAPILEDPDTPGIIMRTTAAALAKLKRTDVTKAGLGGLNAEKLLIEAIAKDPYDYPAYQALAQIYAARRAYTESWDMSDALRAFDGAPDALKAPVNRAEETLARGAPGFFPPIAQK